MSTLNVYRPIKEISLDDLTDDRKAVYLAFVFGLPIEWKYTTNLDREDLNWLPHIGNKEHLFHYLREPSITFRIKTDASN